ncbi:L,D-transpeptidase family protein [Lactobacillus sp. ESL0681]|uniref:L,D-transpeptidase family protein n=1 Tax=Lactobacillus sp. ESL0681 TaxID=2983211 RepID=UPI0023F80176|nr:L,D-transpeptidase family protein [Lactobacillus sp. ESL0681]WEV39939.1 L,D-transpeptidase family protein [Lactobacillus sp. ESL0681]
MQSRKDLKKHNNRNNLYLITAGIILSLLIVFGVVLYNQHVESQKQAREFATNHFNPNVSIYGVKVGNLTINKATKKINAHANNLVLLEQGKVSIERDPSINTIDKQTVAQYFKKQHTAMPDKRNYNYRFQALAKAKQKFKNVSHAEIDYQIAGKTFKLKAQKLINQATFKNGKYSFTNVENLTAKLNQMNNSVSTLHQSYKFTVPVHKKVNGNKITVKNQSYGWGIYTKKAQSAIEQAFLDGTKTLDGKNYIYGLGYSTYGLGYGKSNHGIGDNYVVISLKKQELWIIRKGKLAVHLTDVVTGTKNGGKGNRTPVGVWYIQYKQSPATLRGNNDDGSKYSSKVQYWMPFTLSGCGLHDASWRTDWSKKAYLRGGSHGCINIKPSEIKSVWHNVIKHEAVIVYD